MILKQKWNKYRKNELHNQEKRLSGMMKELQKCRSWSVLYVFLAITVGSCVSEPSRTYKKEFVNTYAELTLLYEKQKMEKKETDSSYQILVKEFFDAKGIQQDAFKKAAEELSQQPQVWKLFINDVTAAIDSIKSVK